MIKITPNFTAGSVQAVNNDIRKDNQNNQNIPAPSIEQNALPNIQPDFAVKTPMVYSKLGDFNIPCGLKGSLYKLANGQRVILIPKDGPTVVKTYVNTGSMNEPDDLRGISHYIEHNLFNGSDGLESGEFFQKVDQMGASTNASTGFSETNYFIRSNLLGKNDLENKIKIHASMLETPKFAQSMLDKEKGIVNSEINMITGDPVNIGLNKALKNLYQINTKSVDMIGGTTSNINSLTRDNIVNYFNTNYYPANMTTVITGEIEPEKTIQLVAKYFNSTKRPPASRHFENLNPINKPVREDIISDKATATSVILTFDGPKNNDTKAKILTQALAQILTMSKTSRIDKKLLDYNSSAITEIERISTKPDDGRAIMIMADGTEENSEKIIKTIYTEIAKIASNPPEDDELNVVKKRMLKDFSNLLEQSAYTNALIGGAFLDNDLNIVTDFEKIVNSITPEDITQTAKKYLNLNKCSMVVVHPAAASEESINRNYTETKKIPFTGSTAPKHAIDMQGVKEYRLDNNFAVVLHDTQNKNACFDILYSSSKYPQNTKPAADALLFKILNAGTMDKNEIEYQQDLDKNSIDTVFASGQTDLKIKSDFYADDMEHALKSAKEVLTNPRFKEETLNRMKRELKDDIMTMDKDASDKLLPELYKGLPQGYSKEEILNSIDSVTLDDIKSLYNYILKNGQANIVVSAPFSTKPELKQLVFNEIAELPQVAPKNSNIKDIFEEIPQTKVLTDVHSKSQAQIIEAYKFPMSQNMKDEITLNLLNTILGGTPSSRLFQDLRENQKLAYSVHSNVNFMDNIGTLTLEIGTTTENKETGEVSYNNLQKAIEGFNKHIQKLKTEKVTDTELKNAKLKLKDSILNANETNKGKNGSLEYGLISPYGIYQENKILETIDEITPDDIYNAANYIFKGKPLYSILATENTLKENKTYLDSLAQTV